MRAGGRVGALVVALATLGCADRTAILLTIDSSLRVPEDVDGLEVEVTGLESGGVLERSLALETPFPHSFSVLPGDDPSEQVRVTVTATRGGDPVVRRVLVTSFRSGAEVQLPVELFAACAGIECAVGIDCVSGRCTNDAPAVTGTGDAGPPGCEADEECDDGDPCNGREECEGGSCVSTGVPDCDDGVACTADGCEGGACTHVPDDSLCAVGDACDAAHGCGGRECGGDGDCDDGRACNGLERCVDGTCRTDPEPECDDGVTCTVDRCDEATGGCVSETSDAICDDGLFCNGAETCDPAGGCSPGSAPGCDDGDACTDDFCSNMAAACVHQTRDVDGDGFGDAACAESGGVPATDCNDRSGSIHPGAPEACDGTDQDCDGSVDEGCGAGCDEACPEAATVTLPGGRQTPTASGGAYTGSCGGAGAEAVLSFTLTVTSDVFVTTHGSGVDTVLYVRSCRCAGSELACNDDADGRETSVLRLTSVAPGTYNVFADTEASMSVPLQVDLYATPTAGTADRCGRALALPPSISGNTCGAASDQGGGCEGGSDLEGPDHVYYFVVDGSAPRTVTLDTCTGCTRFDTTLDVRATCTGSGSRVACAAEGCRSTCAGGPPRLATLTRDLSPGLYYVFVDGPAGECGDYTLTATGL